MSVLSTSLQLGSLTLPNRVIMAPLTRSRAGRDRVPTQLMARYYTQRAGAGLILTEATSISPRAVGYLGTPGIWSVEQVRGWARITDAVHAAGGRISLQLWHVGRISDPELLGGALPVAPSPVKPSGRVARLRPLREYVTPHPLSTAEVRGVVTDYRNAAANARRAGFDGVEVHGANGYLIDQFLRSATNHRGDGYGGAVAKRTRFLEEIVGAIMQEWDAQRIGVHLSPRRSESIMGDPDAGEVYPHVAGRLAGMGVGYLFVRESEREDSLLDTMKRAFSGPVIANDSMGIADGERLVEQGSADAVAFGRDYIANPDLAERIALGAPLNTPDTTTFYPPVDRPFEDYAKGYVDYPALALESSLVPGT